MQLQCGILGDRLPHNLEDTTSYPCAVLSFLILERRPSSGCYITAMHFEHKIGHGSLEITRHMVVLVVTIRKLERILCVYCGRQKREKEKESRYIQRIMRENFDASPHAIRLSPL